MTSEWIQPGEIEPLSGEETFDGVDATVRDFWSFAMSDLRTNNVRGYLAEFLVAQAVGAIGQRVEWDTYDVLTSEGIRVEVKATGRLQVWAQRAPSRVAFTGLKGRVWSPEAGYAESATHNADVYVFAIQTAVSHEEYDPLDVSQWEFYVVGRPALETTGFASIGLVTLQAITDGPVSFEGLHEAIRATAL